MACNNATMIRYVVAIESVNNCAGGPTGVPSIDNAITAVTNFAGTSPGNKVLDTITKVGGLGLGEEGTTEVPYWDRVVTLPDGKRKLPDVTMQKRINGGLIVSPSNDPEFDFFAYWFQAKDFIRLNMWVYITNRAWQILYRYRFIDLTLRSWKQEDQELGANKLGLLDYMMSPNDVELWNCSTVVIASATASSSFVPGVCAP